MKCERCGKEANVYYRSSVNGKVTNMNLCSECAEKYGNEMGMINMNPVFDNMFSDMFGSFAGLMSPWGGFGFGMPRAFMPSIMPKIHIMLEPVTENGSAENAASKTEQQFDPEMSKRRELNALREQMNEAVKNEDYEKAAELGDKIRGLEK